MILSGFFRKFTSSKFYPNQDKIYIKGFGLNSCLFKNSSRWSSKYTLKCIDIENTLSGNSTMWKRLRFHFPGFWTLTCFPLRAKWYSQKTCWQLMFLEKTKSDIQWKRTGFEVFCDFCLFNITRNQGLQPFLPKCY